MSTATPRTKPRTKLDMYTYSEATTFGGQLVEFTCHPDDVEKVKAFLKENVRGVSLPNNKEHNVAHGGYGRYTRFKITQHKYAGGSHGFIEAITIENPPDGRWPYVIHEYDPRGSTFHEFETLEIMLERWDPWWQRVYEERPKKGLRRSVTCGFLSPWFYAMGDQIINGDFVIPDDGLYSSALYVPGRAFVVTPCDGKPEIKTVLCCMMFKQEASVSSWMSPEKAVAVEVIKVIWTDGTQTDTDSSLFSIRPAEASEIWIDAAVLKFKSLLAGDLKSFEIPFSDGDKFVGGLRKGKQIGVDQNDLTLAGRYYLQVYITKKKERVLHEGSVDFRPSEECPTVLDYVKEEAKGKGWVLDTVVSVSFLRRKGWRGVYHRKTTYERNRFG